jgi:restriction endonuclease S subunit
MKTFLKNLATIQSGHPFPTRIEETVNGTVGVIQMKDLPNAFQLTAASPVRINTDEIKERYLLEADDIIFRSRGQTNTCTLLKADLGPIVAAAPLMTLRVTSESLLPDYLCWWINQQPAQTHFDRHARGTYGRMISRDALEDLEINVPPLNVQKQIVELALLGEREQDLLTRLAEKKKVFLSRSLTEAATL